MSQEQIPSHVGLEHIVRTVSGNPSVDELAAATLVLASMIESAQDLDRPRDIVKRRTAWQLSQRGMRGGGSASDPFGGSYRS